MPELKVVMSHQPSLTALENLFGHSEDLALVWPKAIQPFNHEQWSNMFQVHPDNLSLLFSENGQVVGHTALLRRSETVFTLSFVYLAPEWRGRGIASTMINQTESVLRSSYTANELQLVVRDYNPRAHKLYVKHGFKEISRDGTAIIMCKTL